MKTIRYFAVLLPLLAFCVPVRADTVTFKDNRAAIDDPQFRINADTMKQIVWSKPRNADKGSAYLWEISSYMLSRNARTKEAQKFEETWNKALRAGPRSTWSKMEEWVDSALKAEESKPPNYDDLDHARLRLLAYRLCAKASLGKDIAEDIASYAEANKAYATKLLKDYKVGSQFQSGDFAGIDYGAAHSSTYDVLMAIGAWHRGKGQFEEAYNNGYRPAKVLAEELRKATNRDILGSDFAIPALTEAARMFSSGDNPQWEMAATMYADIKTVMIAIDNYTGANRAEMAEARCHFYLGDEKKATATYRTKIREYEKKFENGPPPKGWLTPETAAVYAAAYAGFGRIEAKKKNHFEALQYFVKALAFFSSDDEERADALLNAGLTSVELAKANNQQSKYYYRSGKSYYDELTTTFKDTAAAKKASELLTALNAIAPKS